MTYVFLTLVSVVSGIIGGMGMGGGTILIPALTLLFSFLQHSAQQSNLIAFIPMAIVAIIIHAKHRLIKFKPAILASVFAGGSAMGFAFLAQKISGKILSLSLGIFLILVAIFMFIGIFGKKQAE